MNDISKLQRRIKCVVWDLDNTLWRGIAVERSAGEDLPAPSVEMLAVMDELERRGIVSSVASRNDPSMRDELLSRGGLAEKVVAPQIGWEPKSSALKKIAATLNIGVDALAFVDDSAFERAEVAFMLPQVLVLGPEEILVAMTTDAFGGGTTAESNRRAEMYRQEASRKEAEAGFAGSRAEFLAGCEMRLSIESAGEGDLGRVLEMTERTHQLNSTGRTYTLEQLRARSEDPKQLVAVARLRDRFGDYGMIGAALVNKEPPGPEGVWLIELVMLSCRVEGRGIPAALVIWLMEKAREAGMRGVRAVYQVNERNLPIRMLFRQLGFSKVAGGDFVTVVKDLSVGIPKYPEWLEIEG